MKAVAYQQNLSVSDPRTYDLGQVLFSCPHTGTLLDVRYDWNQIPIPARLSDFERRWTTRRNPADFSGVWRFRELLPFVEEKNIVTVGEGQTLCQQNDDVAKHIGLRPGKLWLQYEGLNPSGSFKDNGMTAAFSLAKALGKTRCACASTGNTSASLALYAAKAGMQAIVFIGSGKIAYGKLSQALDYGALTLQVAGDFDACLLRVRQAADLLGIYLMNSVNPFRLEGQKAIMYRILEALNWEVPDWIVVPGGNLGNCSAFGKAFMELKELGLVKRVPRLAVINATGANTLYRVYTQGGVRWDGGRIKNKEALTAVLASLEGPTPYQAHTVASAIEIGRPVNLVKALRALEVMNGSSDAAQGQEGVVSEVDDPSILRHRALVARYGFGCEPASAAGVGGVHRLVKEGIISPHERVVCILTGHELKDPDATVKFHTGIDMKQAKPPAAEPVGEPLSNAPVPVPDDLASICQALGAELTREQIREMEAKPLPAGIGF